MENHSRQLRTVIIFELLLIAILAAAVVFFWHGFCGDGLSSCLAGGESAGLTFAFLAVLRPFLLTPLLVVSLIGAKTFGTPWGTLLSSLGAAASSVVLFLPSRYLGARFIRPWLETSLPATWRLLRTQDYKIVLAARLVPVFPLDLTTVLFGLAGFRLRSLAVATFFGVLPETYLFSELAVRGTPGGVDTVVASLFTFAAMTLLPLLAVEVINRRRGGSLWLRTLRMIRELKEEIVVNNTIDSRYDYEPGKVPVLLLYGFFASRKSTQKMESMLRQRGHSVFTFNLGGLFGVFNTRNIRELAKFVDENLKVQRKAFGFDRVHVVAHSKGGLTALWWLLRLGGSRYCDKFISMGTPYKGSPWTYLALATPLGFYWRDLWQMRPGSEFLSELHSSRVPSGLKIYCFYSELDKVSIGRRAVFEPSASGPEAASGEGGGAQGTITHLAMNDMGHFDFLTSEAVADRVSELLTGEGASRGRDAD